MGKKNSHTGHRSSKTGRFVTERYAQQHSSATQRESIPNPGRGDTGRGSGKGIWGTSNSIPASPVLGRRLAASVDYIVYDARGGASGFLPVIRLAQGRGCIQH